MATNLREMANQLSIKDIAPLIEMIFENEIQKKIANFMKSFSFKNAFEGENQKKSNGKKVYVKTAFVMEKLMSILDTEGKALSTLAKITGLEKPQVTRALNVMIKKELVKTIGIKATTKYLKSQPTSLLMAS